MKMHSKEEIAMGERRINSEIMLIEKMKLTDIVLRCLRQGDRQ